MKVWSARQACRQQNVQQALLSPPGAATPPRVPQLKLLPGARPADAAALVAQRAVANNSSCGFPPAAAARQQWWPARQAVTGQIRQRNIMQLRSRRSGSPALTTSSGPPVTVVLMVCTRAFTWLPATSFSPGGWNTASVHTSRSAELQVKSCRQKRGTGGTGPWGCRHGPLART